MSDKTNTDRLITEACCGDRSAEGFLRTYLRLAHDIDDCIDESPTPEKLLQTFLFLLSFASLNPFYQKYREQLYPLLAVSLCRYATSVQWEGSTVEREKKVADHLRSDGAMLIEYTALLCGGLEHMRVISPLVWSDSWKCHHDTEDRPQ
jgi:hypothetical protein